MRVFDPFDHELSLISALAYLALVTYAGYVILALQLSLFFPKSRNSRLFPETSKMHVASIVFLLLLAIELPLYMLSPADGLADLVKGSSPKLNDILARVPSIQQGPAPPLFFRNRHIQFFPWLIQNEVHSYQGIEYQRIDLEVTDCDNKMVDCEIGTGAMKDTITLDVFPPLDGDSKWKEGFNDSSPVIFCIPGLRSHSQDLPGNMIVRKAYEHGFRSIVVNRRGHTPDQPLKSPRWNLFGDVDDFEQVYWHVKRELVAPNTPLFLYGISSGTAIPVSAMSKWDKRRVEEPERESPSFVGVVAVTPGYDVTRALRRDRFLWPYSDIMLYGVKSHFVTKNEEILRGYNSSAVDDVLAATSLQGVVDAAYPFAGYDTAEEYYEDTNPVRHIRHITTPSLILNSLDDPCCNVGNLYEQSPHVAHEGMTYDTMVRQGEHSLVAVTRTGSHCPFLCSRDRWLPFTRDPLTGNWMLNSWADQVSVEYFEAALEVYGERRFM